MAKLSHVSRNELGDAPVSTIAVRGKELQVGSTVGAARRLLALRAVKVVPVLSGRRYVGVVDQDVLTGQRDDLPVRVLARALVPVATAQTPAREALAELDLHGGTRLVVLEGDQATYVGVVCLRGDRRRLCVDATRLDSRSWGSER